MNIHEKNFSSQESIVILMLDVEYSILDAG